jgi:hypothetical protein
MQRWGWFGERCIRGPAGGDPPRRTGPETRVRCVRVAHAPTLARGTGQSGGGAVCGGAGRRGVEVIMPEGGQSLARGRLYEARRPLSMPEGSKQRPKAANLGKGAEAPKPELISAPLAWFKKPSGGLRNSVSRGVAANEGMHAGSGGDARRRLLRAAPRAGVRVCVAGARDGRVVACCVRRGENARATGLCWLAVCMRMCNAPWNVGGEEDGADVRAPRAPHPSWAGASGQCARRAFRGARGAAGGVTDRTRHGLLGATPLGLASPMGDLF